MLTGRNAITCGLAAVALSLIATFGPPPAAAEEWQAPSQWRGEGGVLEWRMLDANRYRNAAYLPFLEGIHRPRQQHRIYKEALQYDAEFDSLSLDRFMSLTPDEQDRRRDRARSHLKYVRNFLSRIHGYVQYTREEMLVENWTSGRSTPANQRTIVEAMAAMINAAGLDPSNPWNWHELAYFSEAIGDLERSAASLDAAQAALELLPAEVYPEMRLRIALDRAWLLRNQGEYQESMVWVERALAMQPRDEEATLIKGLNLAGQGDLGAALEVARQVSSIEIRKFPLDVRSASTNPELIDISKWRRSKSDYARRWIEALAYLANGEPQQAAHALGELATAHVYPYAKQYWSDVGLILELLGQAESAQALYGLAVTYRPYFNFFIFDIFEGLAANVGNPGRGLYYYLGYGSFYMTGSRFGHATNLMLLYEEESNLFLTQQLADQAVEALSVCIRRGIRPIRSMALRGRMYYMQQEYGRAQRDLDMVMRTLDRIEMGAPSVCIQAAIARMANDDLDGALEHLDSAVELAPDWPLIYRTRAVVLLRKGMYDEGRAELDRALRLDDQAIAAWYNRGLLNLRLRNLDAAVVDLRRATDLAPDNAQVVGTLEAAEMALRREQSGEAPPPTEAGTGSTTADLYYVEGRETMTSPLDERGQELMDDYRYRSFGDQTDAVSAWDVEQDQASEKELKKAFADDPSEYNRQNLARKLIRNGKPEEGRARLLADWSEAVPPLSQSLILEADRQMNDASRAREWVVALRAGNSPNEDPYFWSLVALVCFEQGFLDDGSAALDKAIELAPNNAGLQLFRTMIGS